MERNLLIELLEDGDKVSLYSPHFEGEEYSEFEKFLLAYKDTYPDDVRQLVYRLDIIKRDGAADKNPPEDRHPDKRKGKAESDSHHRH